MSIATLILGQSGTGKSTSLRNLNPADVLLIQSIRKPLPFRSKEWKELSKDGGSIFVSDDSDTIIKIMEKSKRPIIIIDDFQYIMGNEFMRRCSEKGYDKFTEIGKKAWDIFNKASQLSSDKRVYIMSHSDESDSGKTKMKTIGKMLDDKITMEGMVSLCFQTTVVNGQYKFITNNDGNNTAKTPIDMFDSEHIDNDLNAIDKVICEYFQINQQEATQ